MRQEGGEEGPPSQMPTPQQDTRTTAAAVGVRSEKAAGNPFRNQQPALTQQQQAGQGVAERVAAAPLPAKDRPKSSEEIGQAAAAYRGALLSSRSEKDLQTEDGDLIPASAIPSGNILTAVRNEVNPPHIPPGSRTKTPKTPSPKKMDQILQRDQLNKRRFLLQQQAAAQAGGEGVVDAGVAAQQMQQPGPSYGTRSSRYAQQNSSGMGEVLGGNGVQQQQQGQQQGQGQMTRFGKLIPAVAVPFPSIASRMSNITGRISSQAGPTGKKTGGVPSAGGSVGGAGVGEVSATHMHHSNTILHSGSNVINSEYGAGGANNQY